MSRFTYYYTKYVLIPCVLLLSIALFFSFTSNAASGENDIYFPMDQNANSKFTDFDIQSIESIYDSENYNIFAYFSGYAGGYGTRMKNFYIVRFPKDQETPANIFGEINSNGYTFSLYGWSNPVLTYGFLQILDQGWTYQYSASMSNFQNIPSNIYNTEIDYVSNFKVYTSNASDHGVVLRYGSDDPVIPDLTGHAVPPDFDGLNPFFHTGHNKPTEVPQFRGWTSYTWNTYNPPAFDDTDVLSAIESVGNIISYTGEYLVTNIGGAINNLGSNIKGFFEDLGNILIYYGGLIIDNIQNAVTNIYENFATLFENVTTFFNNLVYLGTDENGDFSLGTLFSNLFVLLFIPNDEDLADVLVENDRFGLISFGSNLTTFYNNFVTHLKNDTAIYVIEIPQFVLAGVTLGPYYISFQWYYDNYKSVGDSIISAFLVFGFFMWIYHRFPYWLRGQQGDVSGSITEVQKK